MFILINFFVSLTVFVNAKHYEVMYHPSQNNILRKVFSETVDLKTLTQLGKVRKDPANITYSPTNDLGRMEAIEAFPNHAIEIHVERTQGEPPQIPNQFMNWLRANPNFQTKARRPIERSGENLEMPTTSFPTSTTMAANTTTSTSMFTTSMSDLLTSRPTDNTIHKDNRKRPLYMEDLIQALEDFDKKTKQDHFTARNISGIDLSSDEDPNRPLVKKDLWDLEAVLSTRDCEDRHGTDEGIKDFNDVINLISKGVKVQLEVTTPAGVDSDLNWVPIKIPK